MTTINHSGASGKTGAINFLPPFLLSSIHFLCLLLFPLLLGFGAIRSVITINFPALEYKRIQPDMYGWSDEERLEKAEATLNYLRSGAPANIAIDQLALLRLPEEPEAAFYNERELHHMIDVKQMTDFISTLFIATASIVLICLTLIALKIPQVIPDILFQAGWVTLLLVASLGILIVSSWELFFIVFHEVLFPSGSYTFEWTDSLIRLFPPQFWLDFGLLTVALILSVSIGMIAVGRRWKRSRLVEPNYPANV